MSKSGETASGEEQGGQSTASVFDFLYNDSRRVGSYLAQLDENGLLTEIRRGEQASKDAKRGFSIGGQVLGTGGNVEWTPEEGGGESAERVYDLFWANARELLDALDAEAMIRRDLGSAPIGSLVLLSGQMSMVDLSLLRDFRELPSMRDIMIKGVQPSTTPSPHQALNRQARRSQGKQPAPS